MQKKVTTMSKTFYVSQYGQFCSGVNSAIDMAVAASNQGDNVYCLGDIVHNHLVMQNLSAKGVAVVQDVEDIPCGATVVIRAHGVSPAVLQQCKLRQLKIVDATCPYVRAIQQKALKYHKEGYQVVLVGDASHPEIVGIDGWCDNKAIITDGSHQVDVSMYDKVLIMFQTTYDTSKYEIALQNILSHGVKTLEIFNTICYTTTGRQNFAHFVSKISDLVVVVGDKHSSNTRKLYDIATSHCNNCLWISDTNEVDIDLSQYKVISFVSGASTPKELIEGVIKLMSEIAKETVEVVTVAAEPMTDEKRFAQAVENIKEVKYRPGQKTKVTVSACNDDGVVVRLTNWKQDAFVPNEELVLDGDYEEFKKGLKTGDKFDCIISSIEKSKITLSKKALDERYKDDEQVVSVKEGKPFEITIVRTGKDCLIGKLGSYTVIVHASQIKLGFVKELDKYVGKKLTVVSSEDKVDDNKRTISASAKTLLLAAKKEKEDAFWNNIELNEIVEGKVVRFANFGAFVSVRDFDCLAHTSDLSWTRIGHPQEVLEIGKTYEFAVLDLNREKNRVSLGYKQLQPKPWELAADKYVPGTIVKGKVARIMEFGAFIELEKGIDGLVHISNVSWEWLDDVTKAIKVGDEIEVQVLEFDGENKRITLSRKAVLPKPDNYDESATSTEE